MRPRLFAQIYFAFLGIAVLCVVSGAVVFARFGDRWADGEVPRPLTRAAVLLGDTLPSADAPRGTLERALQARAGDLGLRLTVRDRRGRLLAAAGAPLPFVAAPGGTAHWVHDHRSTAVSVPLPDGRWLQASPAWSAWRTHRKGRFHVALLVVAAVVAAGCWPLARRITRRLEALRAGVEDLGAGALDRRVPVEGRDEVADLARSFNAAADRIQRLVEAQRRVLASASHELRSPLARLRIALEMLADEDAGARPDPEAAARRRRLGDEAERDVAELDALIGDLLLAARLEAQGPGGEAATVDLHALLAEEAARVGADVSGEPSPVRGDPRALRRMVRNLLENAARHGGGQGIEASVESLPGGGFRVVVADRGPGVPAQERERIFEPFYRPAGHREGADGGVGLGLALVREVASRHGGAARCLPRDGGGTRFEVEVRGLPGPGPTAGTGAA